MMKTLVTRKKEERSPHHQYEVLGDNEISLKWSKMAKSNISTRNVPRDSNLTWDVFLHSIKGFPRIM